MTRAISFFISTALLSACGSLSRPAIDTQSVIQAPQHFTAIERFRFIASDHAQAMQFMHRWEADRVKAGRKGVTALAVSGGGANGAFGAEVLVGWTHTGNRPQFDLVTGVSTGALIAPLALAGKYWDARLSNAYHSESAQRLTYQGIGVLSRPSLYSGGSLADLIAQNTSAELLHAIAAEHRTGRRLLVATTNLDTQQTSVWDMGSIALSAEEPGNAGQALALFRTVLTTSASVPGIFPPILITDGSTTELHADGGINAPFLLLPEALTRWQIKSINLRPERIYIIINGQAEAHAQPLKGGALAIMGRSFESMSRANTRIHLAVAAAFAKRHGVLLNYTELPANIESNPLDFRAERMAALFEIGNATAKKLYADDFGTVTVVNGQPKLAH